MITYDAIAAPDNPYQKNFPAIQPEIVPGFDLHKADELVNLASSMIAKSIIDEKP